MAVIYEIGEEKKLSAKQREFIERAGTTDWILAVLHSAIVQLKRKRVRRGKVIKVITFLESFFSLTTGQMEPDAPLLLEFETQSDGFCAKDDYHAALEEVAFIAQQGYLSLPMALRIVRIARLWYNLHLHSI